ncbi:arsenical resistance protein ArsH [Novosphingobium fluoreni]|uniref:Arsenical resistance protein ArsH n=1 Tax=Novosphingobium fluoreni TaxID=1391222 RepID=A0A7W6BYD4_9SPHN|nr:arsenical resistance protein ArsH [Novosphingobium fluoreni]
MTRIRTLIDRDHLPALDRSLAITRPGAGMGDDHPPPRILLLYGSLRERSFSRLATEEAARLLMLFGAEVRIFDPSDLPLPDQVAGDDHPAVHELRQHALWSEGMVWCSPERHGQITGIMKAQIDHLPLEFGGMRPTQGRTLAAASPFRMVRRPRHQSRLRASRLGTLRRNFERHDDLVRSAA